MKFLAGLMLGLMLAAAFAQTPSISIVDAYMNAGVGPTGRMAPIRVDADGYAICSDQKKP